MTDPSGTTRLDLARQAAERGDWGEAYELLRELSESEPLSGPDIAFYADVAYAAGRLDVTIATWERAHADAVRSGDDFAAAGAAVRVAMHLLFDTSLMAPVRGWIKRAERLLDEEGDTPVHAWLAVVRTYERLLSGDIESARRAASTALAIGAACDPAAAAIGRVAEARCRILAGEVTEGLALLQEAGVSAASGELDPLSSGVVYCEVVCALQALAQYDLAEEWTTAMELWRHGRAVGSIHGRCRVHRAEILRLRGTLDAAEGEALRACEELRPYLGRELGWPLTELGRIRLHTGDLDGAEQAFRRAHEIGWDPFPGLALVYLARGEGTLAAHSIREALARPLNVPSKELPPNTELRRAPLLAAQVEIEVETGGLDEARAAASELADIAATFQSNALTASAATARARLSQAEGDPAGARESFAEAVQLWSDIGAPYETAKARLGLARAHRALGSEARSVLEFEAARSGFERVGASRDAEVTALECGDAVTSGRRHGHGVGAPPGSAGRDTQNVFRREDDHWFVAFGGHSARVRDLKGFGYIASLLANPGREVHACDLAAAASGISIPARAPAGLWPGDAGPLLDDQAKAAYRRRLAEIDEDIDEARELRDHQRLAQAQSERDFLVRELARAVGLGGRERRAGSPAERARVSVTRAVRRAIGRLGEHHPPLAEHLDRFIRTGTYCAYMPDPRVRSIWLV